MSSYDRYKNTSADALRVRPIRRAVRQPARDRESKERGFDVAAQRQALQRGFDSGKLPWPGTFRKDVSENAHTVRKKINSMLREAPPSVRNTTKKN